MDKVKKNADQVTQVTEKSSDEQKADLLNLQMMIDKATSGTALNLSDGSFGSDGDGIESESPPEIGIKKELASALYMAAAALSPMYPSLKKIYTEQQCEIIGDSIGAVCIKRGWLSDGLFSEYGEEVLAAAVIFPVAMSTYKGIIADIDAKKADGSPVTGTVSPENTEPVTDAGGSADFKVNGEVVSSDD